MSGYNDEITDNISTIEECLSLCKDETDFICRSVEYFVSGGNNERCSLAVDNYASVDESSHSTNDYVKYWEVCDHV